jgi:hypothetical protein
VIAIIVYAVLGILVSEFVTAFLQDSPWEIFIQIQDAVFKVIEFLLVVRITLKLFAISSAAGPFVGQVYSLTEWSQGIIPSHNFLSGYLDVSPIIILVVIVAIDMALESVISSLSARSAARKREPKSESKGSSQNVTVSAVPAKPAPTVSPQNITINVPMPAPHVGAAEKQVINVFNPGMSPVQPVSQSPRLVDNGLRDAERLPEG